MKKPTIRPTLNSLHQSIAAWQKRTFPNATPEGAVEHLRREAEELHEHFFEWSGDTDPYGNLIFNERRQPGQPLPSSVDVIAEEAADVFFMIVQLSTVVGFSLVEAVAKKYAKNIRRTWKEPDEYGVVEHET